MNHIAPLLGNLEASVRSRRQKTLAQGLPGDLIEAGLSEPAGGLGGYGDLVFAAGLG